jgi:heme o synthase
MAEAAIEQRARPRSDTSGGEVADYFALLKPRVMSLVIFTALVGMLLAPGRIDPFLGFVALLAIAVGAGASGALNMWYDADIDANMQRTAARPIPRGSVAAEDALAFGIVLSVLSVATLGLFTNWLAGGLLAFTIFFYVVIYTMWLKRSTAQNIVIGGAAGAFPPMIGWAAVTGSISLESVVLFAIIFLWTPPHFWALALYRSRDYERAGVPMLPVVAGLEETRRQIVIYAALMVAAGIAPLLLGFAGWFYGAVSIVLGAFFMHLSVRVKRVTEGRAADQEAKKLFLFSILYLFAVFAALLIEQVAGMALLVWKGA